MDNGEIYKKLEVLKYRDRPQKYVKQIKDGDEQSSTVKRKVVKTYSYYICDYCGKEIKIEDKWEKRTGGITTLPLTLDIHKTKLALHNVCFKEVLKELEDGRNK